MNFKKVFAAVLIVGIVLGATLLLLSSMGVPFLYMAGSGMKSFDDSAPMMGNIEYSAMEESYDMDGGYYDDVEMRESLPEVPWEESGKVDGDKKIWWGDMNLKVENLEEAINLIEEKAHEMGGFVSDSYVNRRDRNFRTASITLRVPVKEFRALMTEVSKVGELESSGTSGEDVTRQYIDMEARLNNLTAQEKRLLEILDLSETVEEILMVEMELQRVRGQIEVLTADFNYLRNRVDLSTLSIYLTESPLASPGVTSPKIGEIISNGYRSLINSINGILIFGGEFVIFIMGAIPYLLLISAVVAAVVLIRRARGNKGNDTLPPAA
ncbi:DUF4349 domain-containing protein [Candidatus Contubernalis alkaliaceticus]|uniref:DUF4349 domain-containing protein n=1 Tax=Candidatus Contubernalis alkaliaceticus TaxID=338645 RepID=UPI001F4BF94B|nr:DUF4349 domain-containing protein [Candidatus Contubernalis alkalaceticus]UNC93436.1 DUF4349 domain-containing protein [Candidatus Contubernalis alkalaceticus]